MNFKELKHADRCIKLPSAKRTKIDKQICFAWYTLLLRMFQIGIVSKVS